jgi:hypothetical protein
MPFEIATPRQFFKLGRNTAEVTVGKLTVWFSYETPIAFQVEGQRQVVRENSWGQTTGKHINQIDQGDRKDRVGKNEFEARFQQAMAG